MVWLTREEHLEDLKRRQARMLDLSMNSIRWERQSELLEIFKAARYANEEKRLLWDLPGHGKAYVDCGQVRLKGCDHIQEHASGKVFGRLFKRSCRRKTCPTCSEGWAAAEAERALIRMSAFVVGNYELERLTSRLVNENELFAKSVFHRKLVSELETLLHGRKRFKPVHFVLSPPQEIQDLSIGQFRKLRDLAYAIARESGIWGGAAVFHPYRLRCSRCGSTIPEYQKDCPNCHDSGKEWFWSPHFHIVGFGWLESTKEGYSRHHWVVKGLGVRESVFATFQYLLSHAGVSAVHTTTWFGKLAYSKLPNVFVLPSISEICPFCRRFLLPLKWIGLEDPPPLEFSKNDPGANERLLEPSEWRSV
jgi:hypothetical protein